MEENTSPKGKKIRKQRLPGGAGIEHMEGIQDNLYC